MWALVHKSAMLFAQHFTSQKFPSTSHGVDGNNVFLNCHAQFFAAPQQSALFNNAEFSASVGSAKAVMEENAWISPSSSMCLRYALLSCSSARSYWGPFEFRKRDPEEGMRGLPKTVELDT
jgi:hypothetical protein